MRLHRTDYFDKTGKLAAREDGEMTYNSAGRAVFSDRLGLAVLGRLLRRTDQQTVKSSTDRVRAAPLHQSAPTLPR